MIKANHSRQLSGYSVFSGTTPAAVFLQVIPTSVTSPVLLAGTELL